MSQNPLVSILIPTRNRKALLAQTLQSVLNDLPEAVEIIISDNCSTDGTQEYLAAHSGKSKFKVLLQKKNLGMLGNWNALMAASNGEFIKILCDDDLLIPGALKREIKVLSTDVGLGLVASKILERSDREVELLWSSQNWKEFEMNEESCDVMDSEKSLRSMFFFENIFGSPSAVLFRKKYWKNFTQEFSYAADWNAWIAVAIQANTAKIMSYGCIFRLHELNLTKQNLSTGNDLEEVLFLRKKILSILRERFSASIFLNIIFLTILVYRLLRRSARLFLRGKIAESFNVWPRILRALCTER